MYDKTKRRYCVKISKYEAVLMLVLRDAVSASGEWRRIRLLYLCTSDANLFNTLFPCWVTDGFIDCWSWIADRRLNSCATCIVTSTTPLAFTSLHQIPFYSSHSIPFHSIPLEIVRGLMFQPAQSVTTQFDLCRSAVRLLPHGHEESWVQFWECKPSIVCPSFISSFIINLLLHSHIGWIFFDCRAASTFRLNCISSISRAVTVKAVSCYRVHHMEILDLSSDVWLWVWSRERRGEWIG